MGFAAVCIKCELISHKTMFYQVSRLAVGHTGLANITQEISYFPLWFPIGILQWACLLLRRRMDCLLLSTKKLH